MNLWLKSATGGARWHKSESGDLGRADHWHKTECGYLIIPVESVELPEDMIPGLVDRCYKCADKDDD